jgi:hypothetical protein
VKKFILTVLMFFIVNQVQAYEDCIVTTCGKLTDISIEDNTIVDVYPLITVMNDKNVLIFHPLNVGKTKVCVLKNGKDKIMFNIEVNEEITVIDEVSGFDILAIDSPPEIYDIDLPPTKIPECEG